MDPETVAILDKVVVTTLGILTIVFIYWFFLGKEDSISDSSTIIVDGGYKPSIIRVPVQKKTELTFFRKDSNSCLEEIIIPDFKIKEYLPLQTPVTVTIHPLHAGEYDIHCGMNMYHGKVVAV